MLFEIFVWIPLAKVLQLKLQSHLVYIDSLESGLPGPNLWVMLGESDGMYEHPDFPKLFCDSSVQENSSLVAASEGCTIAIKG